MLVHLNTFSALLLSPKNFNYKLSKGILPYPWKSVSEKKIVLFYKWIGFYDLFCQCEKKEKHFKKKKKKVTWKTRQKTASTPG